MRDDFSSNTKEVLAKRVGYKCSNPNCRKATTGPQTASIKHINIGVAAHIFAAAQGGKRYNSNQTNVERSDINNGIWLCQNCAKLIDSDELRYTAELLQKWKLHSETAALLEVENPTSNNSDSLNINSFNQSGGITAHTVNINNPSFALNDADQNALKNQHMRFFYRPSLVIYNRTIQTTEVSIIKLRNEGYIARKFSIIVPWINGIFGKLITSLPPDDKLDTDEVLTITLVGNLVRPAVPIQVVISFIDVVGRIYQQEYSKIGNKEEITRPQLLDHVK